MYRPYSSPIAGSGSSMDVESTIRGLSQDFSMNFNTGNYDQVAGLFASDGLFMAPHHESIAGPKALEHIVDTVLYFEGPRQHPHRIVRTIKNRFGPANELGIFEMMSGGFSTLERHEHMHAVVIFRGRVENRRARHENPNSDEFRIPRLCGGRWARLLRRKFLNDVPARGRVCR